MPLFSWVTFSGETGEGDTLPHSSSDFESIAELILHRDHSLKPAASHPVQEAAMKKLPPNLRVLRAEYCRLRTFPVLPESILEVYFRQNDTMIVPDLTHLKNCIVMEFGDNRVEELNCARLPPPLTRVGFPVNALSSVKNTLPESCLNWDFTGNPSRCRFDIGQYCSKGTGTGTTRTALYKLSDSALKKVNAFANEQSSHNPSVQKSAELNCAHIVSYRPEVPFMSTETLLKSIKQTYMDSELKSPIPLLKPFLDGFYSQNGTTLERLVERLWLRISDAEGTTKYELLKRFAEELEDADLKCSNGVMVRLANNVLIGFDDAIKMRATNNEILSMRVPNTIRRVLIGHKMDTPQERLDYWQRVYLQTIADLEDVEEPRKDWREWLQPISEEILHIAASQLSQTSIDDIEQTSVMLKESYKLLGDLWEVTMLQEILSIPENMRPGGVSSSSTDDEKKYYYNLALRAEKGTITSSETEKLRKYLSTVCFGCLVWIDFVHTLEHDATNTIQIIVEATQSKDHNRYLISVTESGDVTHTPLPSHKDISDVDVCLYLIASCLSLEYLGGPPVDETDVQRLKDRIGFYYHIDPTTIKVQCIPSDTMKPIKINIFQVQDGFLPFCVFTILLNAKGEIVLNKYKGNGDDGYINDVPQPMSQSQSSISATDVSVVLEEMSQPNIDEKDSENETTDTEKEGEGERESVPLLATDAPSAGFFSGLFKHLLGSSNATPEQPQSVLAAKKTQ